MTAGRPGGPGARALATVAAVVLVAAGCSSDGSSRAGSEPGGSTVPVRDVHPDECGPDDTDIACAEAAPLAEDPAARRELLVEVLGQSGLGPGDAACVADLMLAEFTAAEIEALATGRDPVADLDVRLDTLLDVCGVGA